MFTLIIIISYNDDVITMMTLITIYGQTFFIA